MASRPRGPRVGGVLLCVAAAGQERNHRKCTQQGPRHGSSVVAGRLQYKTRPPPARPPPRPRRPPGRPPGGPAGGASEGRGPPPGRSHRARGGAPPGGWGGGVEGGGGGGAAGARGGAAGGAAGGTPAERPPALRAEAPADTAPRSLNLYAATGAGMLSPAARRAKPLVYVPNSKDGTVSVIDPRSYHVVRTFPTGALPQHVVPAYDLGILWVANNLGNSLTPIDPVTGREGRTVPVSDPYNLYFTPDGRFAVVIAERRQRLEFRDAHKLALVASLAVECRRVDHMEITAVANS